MRSWAREVLSQPLARPSRISTPGGSAVPVEEFVSQIYLHGLPLDQAATYGEADVDTLIRMLNDLGMVQYHESIALTRL